MEKLTFQPAQGEAPEDFMIVAEAQVDGRSYLLVTPADDGTDGDEDDTDAFLLRDDSRPEDTQALYTMVEDEEEMTTVWEVFRQLLDDNEEITLEEADL